MGRMLSVKQPTTCEISDVFCSSKHESGVHTCLYMHGQLFSGSNFACNITRGDTQVMSYTIAACN